jgi:hypothetical protein
MKKELAIFFGPGFFQLKPDIQSYLFHVIEYMQDNYLSHPYMKKEGHKKYAITFLCNYDDNPEYYLSAYLTAIKKDEKRNKS